MNLQDYTEMPSEGLYDQIAKRVRRRKMMRRGGLLLAVATVVAVVGVMFHPHRTPTETPASVAMQLPNRDMPMVEAHGYSATEPNASVPTQHGEPQVALSDADTISRAASTVEAASPRTSEQQPLHTEVVAQSQQADPIAQEAPRYAGAMPETNPVKPDTSVAIIPATMPAESPAATPTGTANPQQVDQLSLEQEPLRSEADLMWVPNAIMPNADDEAVRHFSIKWSSPVSHFYIRIYNRRGLLVFQSNNTAFSWDATHDGQAVPQGTYVWIVSYRDMQGRPQQRQGTLTVLR